MNVDFCHNIVELTMRFNKWVAHTYLVPILDAQWSEMGLDSTIGMPDEAFLEVSVHYAACNACCMDGFWIVFLLWKGFSPSSLLECAWFSWSWLSCEFGRFSSHDDLAWLLPQSMWHSPANTDWSDYQQNAPMQTFRQHLLVFCSIPDVVLHRKWSFVQYPQFFFIYCLMAEIVGFQWWHPKLMKIKRIGVVHQTDPWHFIYQSNKKVVYIWACQ